MLLHVREEHGVTIKQAEQLDQRVFGALCNHEMVDYQINRSRFVISKYGHELLERASRWSGFRKHNNHMLAGASRWLISRNGRRVA